MTLHTLPFPSLQALGDSGGSAPVSMVLPKDGSYWGLASVNGVNVLKHEGKQAEWDQWGVGVVHMYGRRRTVVLRKTRIACFPARTERTLEWERKLGG